MILKKCIIVFFSIFLLSCKTEKVYVVTTIAGTGEEGAKNGPALNSTFKYPQGIAIDNQGNIFIADLGNNLIRRIDKSGDVTNFAGEGQQINFIDSLSKNDFISAPNDLIFDKEGNLIICASQNIWRIDKKGHFNRIVGNGDILSVRETTGLNASLWNAHGLAVDQQNNIYVADYGHQLIRKISPSGFISTVGAQTKDSIDFYSKKKPPHFDFPGGITIDSKGNIYISEPYNNKILKYSISGKLLTFAGNGKPDTTNGYGAKASFNWPQGLAIDKRDYIYVADAGNNLIRKISPEGLVTTIAGTGEKGSQDGNALKATFNQPSTLTLDEKGNIYIAELHNNKIRKISLQPKIRK